MTATFRDPPAAVVAQAGRAPQWPRMALPLPGARRPHAELVGRGRRRGPIVGQVFRGVRPA